MNMATAVSTMRFHVYNAAVHVGTWLCLMCLSMRECDAVTTRARRRLKRQSFGPAMPPRVVPLPFRRLRSGTQERVELALQPT